MRLARPQPLLADRVDELRRHAELRHPHLVRVVEQRVRSGVEGRAVVQHRRRPARQRRREPVPHHPAAGRVVEGAVARPDVGVQLVLLEVGEEDPARRVDDALRHAGRARGEEDVEGMIEGKPPKLDLPRTPRGDEVVEQNRARDRRDVRVRLGVGDDDHPLHRREPAHDLGQAVEARIPLPLPEVAVRRQQDAGLDLAEAVEDALHAEVGRCGRDRRPEARRGEHVHDRLRHVGDVAGHAVARGESQRLQRLREPRGRVVELRPAQVAADAVLGPEEERGRVVAPPEQVLREVQPGVGIPARPRQAVEVDDHALAALADDPAEVPHRVPERLRLAHGPAPQRPRVVRARPAALVRVAGEARHVRRRREVRGRRPQRPFRARRARRARTAR